MTVSVISRGGSRPGAEASAPFVMVATIAHPIGSRQSAIWLGRISASSQRRSTCDSSRSIRRQSPHQSINVLSGFDGETWVRNNYAEASEPYGAPALQPDPADNRTVLQM